ncbi:MAG: hypothetical protein KKE16_05265 [Firmicutes bacterium]|nr:hypothetical protein [Bacillota bacterium]
MNKKILILLFLFLSVVLGGCINTSETTTTTLDSVTTSSESNTYLSFINTEYIPNDAVKQFVLSHDYFITVYYDDDIAVFVYDFTVYVFDGEGNQSTYDCHISSYSTIYYYDKELNEIYYSDSNSMKAINLNTDDIRTVEYALMGTSTFPGGYVSFSDSTSITLFPNTITTYDRYEKAYSYKDSAGLHYGIYDNAGSQCSIKLFLDAELLTEVSLQGVCNHTASYGVDFGVFEQTYTYDQENNIIRDRYVVVNTDGTMNYLEIPDYDHLGEVNVYTNYIQFTYDQPFDEIVPSTKSYSLPTLEEIDFRETEIAYWNLMRATDDFFYGYTLQNAFIQVSRSDHSVLVNEPESIFGYSQFFTFYDNEYLIYDMENYPLISGTLYSMDGTVLFEELSYYAKMNDNTSVYMLPNEGSSYDIYFYDLSTQVSTKLEDVTFQDEMMIHLTEEALGLMLYGETDGLENSNHVDIVYYDLEGNYIDTYTRYSHSKYSCFVNDKGEILFSKPLN